MTQKNRFWIGDTREGIGAVYFMLDRENREPTLDELNRVVHVVSENDDPFDRRTTLTDGQTITTIQSGSSENINNGYHRIFICSKTDDADFEDGYFVLGILGYVKI